MRLEGGAPSRFARRCDCAHARMKLGGDTDTLACITGAVAEAIHGIPAEVADAARSHLTDDLLAVLTRFELATDGIGRTWKVSGGDGPTDARRV